MEIRIIPVVAVTVSLAVVVLAVRAGKAKAASIYLDAPNATSSTTKFDAKEVANTLHVAMNKYGTDEDIIMQVLGEVNESQFASVVLAFGSKRYNTWTGDEYGLFKYTLKEWLANELTSSSYLTLKSKFKKYL
jgi:predicted metal-dependent TIM-barrel fold hydrolase